MIRGEKAFGAYNQKFWHSDSDLLCRRPLVPWVFAKLTAEHGQMLELQGHLKNFQVHPWIETCVEGRVRGEKFYIPKNLFFFFFFSNSSSHVLNPKEVLFRIVAHPDLGWQASFRVYTMRMYESCRQWTHSMPPSSLRGGSTTPVLGEASESQRWILDV